MTYDTTKMTTSEIRDELVALGLPEETAQKIKGKANLVSILKEVSEEAGGPEETADLLEDEDIVTDEVLEDITIEHPGWTDHILSLLDKDEKVKKNPTVDGLRRIASVILGDITSFDSQVLQFPTPENEKRATVRVELTVVCHDGITRKSSGVADSYYGNTDKVFDRYPVACAETRAEGRALKRLLRLKRVLTAEEAAESPQDDLSLTGGKADKITNHQVKFIDTMCRERLDLDVVKLIEQQYPGTTDIRSLSYSNAQDLCQILNVYQSAEVPSDLKGFDPNWKSVLDKGE